MLEFHLCETQKQELVLSVSRKIYTDGEINSLILELKPLPYDWRSISPPKVDGASITQTVECIGQEQHAFKILLRQNTKYPLNFSLTLGFIPKGSTALFRLRRYDGKSHEHTNPIENKFRFYDFHIHMATERYQTYGTGEEDKYAIPTDKYNDYEGALKCLVDDCNFQIPNDPQIHLFN
jgi:hypothetical protein